MEITTANEAHVPEMVEMWKEFIDYHKGIDPFFTRRKDGHLNFEKFVGELIKSDDAIVLVAIEDRQAIGHSIAKLEKYPMVFEIETYGFILDMAVKSGHRRKGVGERLLDEIFKWLESRNVDRIELRVAAKNEIGYSFWKKHGFRDYVHILYLNKDRPLKT